MKQALKYGLPAGMGFILIALLVNYTGLRANVLGSIIDFLKFAILAFMIYLAVKERRTAQGGLITYGQGVGTGMLVTTIATILAGIFEYINAAFLAPEMLQSTYEEAMARMEEQTHGNEEQMEVAGNVIHSMLNPGALAFITVLAILFVGLLCTLIIAAILLRTERDIPANYPPHENME